VHKRTKRGPTAVDLLRRKSKLYRFDNDSGEWKERGVGQTRLLKNKENKRIRLLMRQEKTLKIRANHLGAAPCWFCCWD
jgi:Ran-binding protein 1